MDRVVVIAMRSKCNSVRRQNSGLMGRYCGVAKQKDVVIHTKCKGTARILQINIQSLPKLVDAIFSDWEEFRKRKKRRHMLKLLCFLREGSTDFEGDFR